jgi:hypothetical protein
MTHSVGRSRNVHFGVPTKPLANGRAHVKMRADGDDGSPYDPSYNVPNSYTDSGMISPEMSNTDAIPPPFGYNQTNKAMAVRRTDADKITNKIGTVRDYITYYIRPYFTPLHFILGWIRAWPPLFWIVPMLFTAFVNCWAFSNANMMSFYDALTLPNWTMPAWVFGIVWTLIIVAGSFAASAYNAASSIIVPMYPNDNEKQYWIDHTLDGLTWWLLWVISFATWPCVFGRAFLTGATAFAVYLAFLSGMVYSEFSRIAPGSGYIFKAIFVWCIYIIVLMVMIKKNETSYFQQATV